MKRGSRAYFQPSSHRENDQPGKPERSTDLDSEFPAKLRRHVEEIRVAGAHPMLVTPLTRRQFRDGKLVDDLAPRADAVRRVAADVDVPQLRWRLILQGDGFRPSLVW